ncbi:hypothetical protein OC835_007439, partial [Tilletia horrida]
NDLNVRQQAPLHSDVRVHLPELLVHLACAVKFGRDLLGRLPNNIFLAIFPTHPEDPGHADSWHRGAWHRKIGNATAGVWHPDIVGSRAAGINESISIQLHHPPLLCVPLQHPPRLCMCGRAQASSVGQVRLRRAGRAACPASTSTLHVRPCASL